MTTIARPRNPLELIVVLPYQLGYHPGPSVVLVVMHDRRLGMLQRHDLPQDPQSARASARHALAVAQREGATGIMLIAYEDDPGESVLLVEALTEAAGSARIDVGHQLLVRGEHVHMSDECGHTVVRRLPRPEDVPAVAPFVHAGVYPLPSRDHLVRGALPERDEERAAAVARARHPLGVPADEEMVLRVWTRLLDPSGEAVAVDDLRDDELLLLATSVLEVDWRDALLAVLCPGTMPLDSLSASHVRLAGRAVARCAWVAEQPGTRHAGHQEDLVAVRMRLAELTRRVPVELTPSLLALMALVAWWTGDGTIAGTCLERALEVDPEHRLADLLLRLLSAGLRPWEVHDLDVARDSAA